MKDEIMVDIQQVSKQYRLGTIGGDTLREEIQSRWARLCGKEDPNLKIGEKVYSKNEKFMALDNVSFKVYRGEAIGIIGHNGAGKSTLLKLLSRVTAPTSGTIYLNGRITSMLEVGTGFHPELTGRENIYMNGAILGMTKAEINRKIDNIIDFSEVRQFIDTPVKRYSSGMYVKLAFSVAAHLDSEILLMDDVLAAGDVKFQEKCLGRMGQASSQEGKTVLYVSHNMRTIRQLCTRCIVLKKGGVIYDGDVDKAIELYMDLEKSDFYTLYKLSDIQRPSLDHGVAVRVTSFEFLGCEQARFSEGSKVICAMEWKGTQCIKGLRLYLAIKAADETPVGVAKSEIIGEAEVDCEKRAEFVIDLDMLAPGTYFFYINLIIMNEYGTPHSYDRPNKKIFFEIVPNENEIKFDWKSREMGYICFREIKKIR